MNSGTCGSVGAVLWSKSSCLRGGVRYCRLGASGGAAVCCEVSGSDMVLVGFEILASSVSSSSGI